jgi:acyl carrier protein phosphodiesterase
MNWLSHVFLSENNIEHQLGNLLTDALKAKAWEGAGEEFYRGIDTHKKIDAFTDAHAVVARSKSRLDKKGYLKAVVIDIVYDYCLSLHWERFASVGLDEFLLDFYSQAKQEIHNYSKEAKRVTTRVIDNNILGSYRDFKGLEEGFKRIDKRLSARILAKDTASSYLPLVIANIKEIEEDFLIFFPELMAYVAEDLDRELLGHWNSTL